MRKRILILGLDLVLCLGLAVPAQDIFSGMGGEDYSPKVSWIDDGLAQRLEYDFSYSGPEETTT